MVDGTKPRVRERKKAATRRELILAGRKLFGEKGLYESRVEDLTRVAGVAKGTLYQYFGSKDDLVRAVVADCFDELHHFVREHAEGTRSLADLTTRIVEAHLRFFDDNPEAMRILHQARGTLKFEGRESRLLRKSLDLHLDRLTDLLRAASGSRLLGASRGRALAVLLFGSVSGLSSVQMAASPRVALAPPSRDTVRAFVAAAIAMAGGKARVGAFGKVGARRPS